jgi:hypothetical protein
MSVKKEKQLLAAGFWLLVSGLFSSVLSELISGGAVKHPSQGTCKGPKREPEFSPNRWAGVLLKSYKEFWPVAFSLSMRN